MCVCVCVCVCVTVCVCACDDLGEKKQKMDCLVAIRSLYPSCGKINRSYINLHHHPNESLGRPLILEQ